MKKPTYRRKKRLLPQRRTIILFIWLIAVFLAVSSVFAAQGDFSPSRNGITRSQYPNGLSYNEFNLYTDNYALSYMRFWCDEATETSCKNVKNYQDERDFATARDLDNNDSRYYHTLNGIKTGDTIRAMFYYHNNAQETADNRYTAKDVTIDIDFQNPESLKGHLSCSNCKNYKNIYDTATLDLPDNIEFRYVPNSIVIGSPSFGDDGDDWIELKDNDSRLTITDTKITYRDGDVPGCYPNNRYFYIDFIVEEKEAPLECEQIKLNPDSAMIANFLDNNFESTKPVAFKLKDILPTNWDGSFKWTGEDGGSFTAPGSTFRLTTTTTNSKNDNVNFYADREGSKLRVEASENPSICKDYVVVGGECGDGHVWEGEEECDDGNNIDNDECSNDCTTNEVLPYCGDGNLDSDQGEECDDGNNIDGDGCSSDCQIEIPPGLECEQIKLDPDSAMIADFLDTNFKPTKYITFSLKDVLPTNWDGAFKWTGENGGGFLKNFMRVTSTTTQNKNETVSFNAANEEAILRVESKDNPSDCKDFLIVGGECGDGHVWEGEEECDDGNNIDNDECSNDCTTNEVLPYCGDGNLDQGEECDDGNNIDGDGCSSDCQIEPEEALCENLNLKNTEILAKTSQTLSTQVTGSETDYTPNLKWTDYELLLILLGNGTFNGQNPYISGNETDVLFEKGKIGESVLVLDQKNPLRCFDLEEVKGCESISVSPKTAEINVNEPLLITLNINPDDWDKAFTWKSTDQTATFNGQPSDYQTTDTTVEYKGTISATISVKDSTGIFLNPTEEFPYDCSDSLSVTIRQEAVCEDLDILNEKIFAGEATELAIDVDPDNYTPNITWSSDGTGSFDGSNPINSGSDTTVNFTNGSIDEIITVYDSSDPFECTDTLRIKGCRSLGVNPTFIDLDTVTRPIPITITPDPSTWDEAFTWKTSDSQAKFNSITPDPTSGYTTTNRTIQYTPVSAARITIEDATGLFLNPPYACKNEIIATAACQSVTLSRTDIREDEISDGKRVTIEVTTTPSNTYLPDLVWQCSGSGKFIVGQTEYPCNNEEGHRLGNTLSVDFTGGKTNDIIKIFDFNFPSTSACQSQTTILPMTIPETACTGLSASPSRIDTRQNVDIKITPSPNDFKGTFQWIAGTSPEGTLINNTTGQSGSTITSTESETVRFTGADSGKITIKEATGTYSACATEIPISSQAPSCGNGIIEGDEQCEPPGTSSCDASCHPITPGGGGGPGPGGGSGPGGEACYINLIAEDGTVLWDGNSQPDQIPIISNLNFYIKDSDPSDNRFHPGTPYRVESFLLDDSRNQRKDDNGDLIRPGIFIAYENDRWDREEIAQIEVDGVTVDLIENPIGKNEIEGFSGSMERYYTFRNTDQTEYPEIHEDEHPAIQKNTLIQISSESEDCEAKLLMVEEEPSGPGPEPGGEETECKEIKKISPDSLNISSLLNGGKIEINFETDPKNFEGRFTWDTDSTLDLLFNGVEPPYKSVDRDVLVEENGSLNQGRITIKSEDYPGECNAIIPVNGEDSLIKELRCVTTGTNITSDGDLIEYTVRYFAHDGREDEGEEVTFVNIKDSFITNGNIYVNGSASETLDRVTFNTNSIGIYWNDEIVLDPERPHDEDGDGINEHEIAKCSNPDDQNLCQETQADYSIIIKNLKNLPEGRFIEIWYNGNLHATGTGSSELKCEDDTDNTEYFLNEATSITNTGSEHRAYATVWAVCPYILTQNSGDVFFEEPLSYGSDISNVNPVFKNTTGLAIVESPKTAEGQAAAGEGSPAESSSCKKDDNLIGHFSSFICEVSTVISDIWKSFSELSDQSQTIEGRIQENITKITRYNEAVSLELSLGSFNIETLKTNYFVSKSSNEENNIFTFEGDLEIDTRNPFTPDIIIDDKGARTIIVKNGNLIIKSNIVYGGSYTDFKEIPSIAFIVLKDPVDPENTGKILIDKNITTISGVLYAENSLDSLNGKSDLYTPLTIIGSVYGDIQPLFENRPYLRDPKESGGAIVIKYDERILLNTPPGLTDFVSNIWEEVAR